MLSAGNRIGTTKNDFSDAVNSIFGRDKIGSLFILHPMIANTTNAMLNAIKREIVDNGVSYPRLSDKLFTNNPKNIRKEMLTPTNNTTFSVDPILSNLSTWRINNPGKIVRKKNPRICLKNGMFKNIARFVRISSAMRSKKKFPVPKLLDIPIIFLSDYQEPPRIFLPSLGGCIY